MASIQVLSQETIDKIAAGEVVERPASVVKELVENSIDAKATAVTVEIKEGGTSLIRITDNGCGIAKKEIALAFLRHSTSKITTAEDLTSIATLGFRGEALSSISAVAQVELLTKTRDSFTGARYVVEGGIEKKLEEAGTPDGTTFLVRNLFYNTPARKKFLKTHTTEGNYIQDLVERLALSHPEISFKLINNNQVKLHTSGNGNLKDVIYQIYGRDVAANLIEVAFESEEAKVGGFIGKPLISRGNRQYENYFINGRYVKNNIVSKAIEQGYKNYMMQHKYPFTVLHVQFQGEMIDVNVHPAKMELRFSDGEQVYRLFYHVVTEALQKKELIPEVQFPEMKNTSTKPKKSQRPPEQFEKNRLKMQEDVRVLRSNIFEEQKAESQAFMPSRGGEGSAKADRIQETVSYGENDHVVKKVPPYIAEEDRRQAIEPVQAQQMDLFAEHIVERRIEEEVQIIGQVFDTYWIMQFEDKMFLADQHAAHEKVLYERTMKGLRDKTYTSQLLSPPLVVTLSAKEAQVLEKNKEQFEKLGFEIASFGGKEYAIRAIPDNLFQLSAKDLFLEMLDDLVDEIGNAKPDVIVDKIASMSCKAAIKGNQKISAQEAHQLLKELMMLDNPYNCPHGRPVLIAISKYELEKKFKRIV